MHAVTPPVHLSLDDVSGVGGCGNCAYAPTRRIPVINQVTLPSVTVQNVYNCEGLHWIDPLGNSSGRLMKITWFLVLTLVHYNPVPGGKQGLLNFCLRGGRKTHILRQQGKDKNWCCDSMHGHCAWLEAQWPTSSSKILVMMGNSPERFWEAQTCTAC